MIIRILKGNPERKWDIHDFRPRLIYYIFNIADISILKRLSSKIIIILNPNNFNTTTTTHYYSLLNQYITDIDKTLSQIVKAKHSATSEAQVNKTLRQRTP